MCQSVVQVVSSIFTSSHQIHGSPSGIHIMHIEPYWLIAASENSAYTKRNALWICFCDCNTWPNYVTVNKLEPQARHRNEIAMLVTSGTKQWQGTDS
ncbi:hypothetical protein CK203_050459 [Vitis vinifera]|uniref:Uncharacterized protein n=1 Tax=Vitis vinifera TaxID=29760 RepID=A0A438H2I7_VITVI|nr:hypothetical protein CK203_050459 [Vitis vinifera]